jgi:hypothetical protein
LPGAATLPRRAQLCTKIGNKKMRKNIFAQLRIWR